MHSVSQFRSPPPPALNSAEYAAAYNEAGELVGTSKSINVSELPLSVSLAIAAKYGKDAMCATATELNYNGQTQYNVSVIEGQQLKELKCSTNGDIYVEDKE